jgi:hypothetical protein
MKRSAILSDCGQFRYELRRQWSEAPALGWVMLNPSTADASVDDPTVRRCIDFAQRWGYGAIVVRNVYAFRATDPQALWMSTNRWGPDVGHHLRRAVDEKVTVCAWGNNVVEADAAAARRILCEAGANLVHLGLTKHGQPRHPLYVKASTEPIQWTATDSLRPVGDTESRKP